MRNIDPYIKLIQGNLFPALYNSLGLKMNTTPTNKMNTIATYNGDLENSNVTLEFSSNHKELADYVNTNSVFVTLYYNAKATQVGIIDLDDIDSCVEIIYSSLYELGYRSAEDIEEEKRKEEEKKQKEREKQEKEKEAKKKELELYRNLSNFEDDVDDSNDVEDTETSIEEANADFDMYLDYFNEKAESNTNMEISIGYEKRPGSVSFVYIECFYINSTKCLLQNSGISPEIDKVVSWDSAKDYMNKVAEKLNGVISISAYNPDGSNIELERPKDSNNVNLGIDI